MTREAKWERRCRLLTNFLARNVTLGNFLRFQFKSSTQLIMADYLKIPPTMQHHSFSRNFYFRAGFWKIPFFFGILMENFQINITCKWHPNYWWQLKFAFAITILLHQIPSPWSIKQNEKVLACSQETHVFSFNAHTYMAQGGWV